MKNGPYGDFKRATDAYGKFKITETQNKSSQSLYSGKNVANFWENWAWGESPKIVANFWENWARGESPKMVAFFGKNWARGENPRIVAKFWENWPRETPRARQIQKTHVQTQLKDLPSDSGPGGNRTPDRPWPTVLQLLSLSGTLTGEEEKFSQKNSTFLGKSKLDFPKKVVNLRPPSRGPRKHRLSLYSRRLSLYSSIFPNKWLIFGTISLGKLRARYVYSQIAILGVMHTNP